MKNVLFYYFTDLSSWICMEYVNKYYVNKYYGNNIIPTSRCGAEPQGCDFNATVLASIGDRGHKIIND